MLTDVEILEILDKLGSKTKLGQLKWTQDKVVPTAFAATLPRSIIKIGFYSPSSAPDLIEISFLNRETQKPAFSCRINEGDAKWDKALDFYSLVSKKTTGLEEILDDLNAFLASK